MNNFCAINPYKRNIGSTLLQRALDTVRHNLGRKIRFVVLCVVGTFLNFLLFTIGRFTLFCFSVVSTFSNSFLNGLPVIITYFFPFCFLFCGAETFGNGWSSLKEETGVVLRFSSSALDFLDVDGIAISISYVELVLASWDSS